MNPKKMSDHKLFKIRKSCIFCVFGKRRLWTRFVYGIHIIKIKKINLVDVVYISTKHNRKTKKCPQQGRRRCVDTLLFLAMIFIKQQSIPRKTAFVTNMEHFKSNEKTLNAMVNLHKVDFVRLLPQTTTIDTRSQTGQFGWETIGQNHIPFVFRGSDSERYVALRIVNQIVLPHFCNIFTQELFDILVVQSVTITEPERILYNEINSWHCLHEYGLNTFQRGEQLVRVDDVMKLHDVLNFLYARFFMRRSESHPMFGYMAFDEQKNLVPYYKVNGSPCFPVVYFEGDDRYLQEKSMVISSFEECVLRLLMKLQNISPCCRQVKVIGFDELKLYYEKGTIFTECWIKKENDFLVKRGKAEASILKIANIDLIDMAEGQHVRSALPVLLMNPKKDNQRMPPPPSRR